MTRHQPGVVRHEFPIRPDLIIELSLPVALTTADAERLAAFVRSLAFAEASDMPDCYPATRPAGVVDNRPSTIEHEQHQA